jgi:hypothetical protein
LAQCLRLTRARATRLACPRARRVAAGSGYAEAAAALIPCGARPA